jgi:hypothetical protein
MAAFGLVLICRNCWVFPTLRFQSYWSRGSDIFVIRRDVKTEVPTALSPNMIKAMESACYTCCDTSALLRVVSLDTPYKRAQLVRD